MAGTSCTDSRKCLLPVCLHVAGILEFLVINFGFLRNKIVKFLLSFLLHKFVVVHHSVHSFLHSWNQFMQSTKDAHFSFSKSVYEIKMAAFWLCWICEKLVQCTYFFICLVCSLSLSLVGWFTHTGFLMCITFVKLLYFVFFGKGYKNHLFVIRKSILLLLGDGSAQKSLCTVRHSRTDTSIDVLAFL